MLHSYHSYTWEGPLGNPSQRISINEMNPCEKETRYDLTTIWSVAEATLRTTSTQVPLSCLWDPDMVAQDISH